MGEYGLSALKDYLEKIRKDISNYEEKNADYKNDEKWKLLKYKEEYIENKIKEVKQIEEIFKSE